MWLRLKKIHTQKAKKPAFEVENKELVDISLGI